MAELSLAIKAEQQEHQLDAPMEHEEDDDDQQQVERDNEDNRQQKKMKTGKVTQARWSQEDFRDALEYLQSHSTSKKSETDCRVWDKRSKSAKFRAVHYPVQLLAFAAHNTGVQLEQGMSVKAKCGNELCVTRECVVLTFEHKRGPKSADFPPLSQAGRALLKSQARANGKLGELYTRSITLAELVRMHEEKDYAAIQGWMRSSHE
jgi:hypothetical protein